MTSSKRLQIRSMARYLAMGKYPLFNYRIIPAMAYACVDDSGIFWEMHLKSCRVVVLPTNALIDHTHESLVSSCRRRMLREGLNSGVDNLPHLLKRFYNLEFLPQ